MLKKLKEQSDKLQNKLDLKKKYPGYFRPWIFRTAFVILVLILLFAGWFYGFQTQTSLSCNDPKGCVNQLNICMNEGPQNSGFICGDIKSYCLKYPEQCSKEFLEDGEIIGPETPWIIKNFFIVFVIIIFCAFSFNHMLYENRRRL